MLAHAAAHLLWLQPARSRANHRYYNWSPSLVKMVVKRVRFVEEELCEQRSRKLKKQQCSIDTALRLQR